MIWFDKSVLTWSIPVIEPVVAVIAPLKNTFSVNNPKPGVVLP